MNAKIDVTGVCLTTPRLRIREWHKEDLQDFYEYASMEEIGHMAGWNHHTCIEDSQKILDLFIREKKTFAVVWKQTGKVIGSIGLEPIHVNIDDHYELKKGREIGYALHRGAWGKGIMPEAVREVIRYCFEELDYDFLYCGHFLFNHQSQRVIEKLGFHYLKDVDFSTQNGQKQQSKLYIMTKEQYKEELIVCTQNKK